MDAQPKDGNSSEDSGKYNPFSQNDFPAIIEVLDLRIKDPITLLIFGNDSHECGNLAYSFGESLSNYCKKIFFHFIRCEDPLVDKLNIKAFPALKVLKTGLFNKNELSNDDSIQKIDLLSKESFGITKYGLPIGYDLAAILNLIVDISSGIADLSDKIIEKLNLLHSQVNLKAFIGVSCPCCPYASHLASQFAIANKKITVDLISANHFSELASEYSIKTLPFIVVNNQIILKGIVRENELLDAILKTSLR